MVGGHLRPAVTACVLSWAGAFILVVPLIGSAPAQQEPPEDLKQAPEARQAQAIAYCRGRYDVVFRDGSRREFNEFDLRVKTDSSAYGPLPGRPVVIPTGRVGDRVLVIFARPGEMKAFFQEAC